MWDCTFNSTHKKKKEKKQILIADWIIIKIIIQRHVHLLGLLTLKRPYISSSCPIIKIKWQLALTMMTYSKNTKQKKIPFPSLRFFFTFLSTTKIKLKLSIQTFARRLNHSSSVSFFHHLSLRSPNSDSLSLSRSELIRFVYFFCSPEMLRGIISVMIRKILFLYLSISYRCDGLFVYSHDVGFWIFVITFLGLPKSTSS